ncbi:MAG: hypothetical protein FWD67_07345 [Betaproteobacteria bacterium]|nr:hypothetical protein [Betaproteobacteria bacterium]
MISFSMATPSGTLPPYLVALAWARVSRLSPPFMASLREAKRHWEFEAPQDRIEESPALGQG